ncbi:MAG: gluconokinase [Pseudomonadota bacterium]
MTSDIYVVMGVSGCGKSTVGSLLAQALGVDFLEGDTLHPPANVQRMSQGFALSDADRKGWLSALSERIHTARQAGKGLVVSCSALKRAYRDQLRSAAPDLVLVHLDGSEALFAQRMHLRTGHYMPASLLASQLATLERPGPDENVRCFDVSESPDTIVGKLMGHPSVQPR